MGLFSLKKNRYSELFYGILIEHPGNPARGWRQKEHMMTITLDFDKLDGLIPAIVQDHASGEVLMVGFMNPEAWETTLRTGKATFYSRTRQTLWTKGLTSGNVQQVKEIRIDCDNDTVLLKVEQLGGAACHTGHRSCFYKLLHADRSTTVVGKPIFDPEEVYKK
jgi:phosphoribosyl-AMP cyclohydrolase